MTTDKSFGCRFVNTEKCADSCFKCELFHRDYISREAAAGQLRSYKIERDLMVSHNETIDFAISVISAEVTAADVRPVVRARWEDETGYVFSQFAQRVYCPVCKSYAYFYPITAKNYCPNCGADMRETGR